MIIIIITVIIRAKFGSVRENRRLREEARLSPRDTFLADMCLIKMRDYSWSITSCWLKLFCLDIFDQLVGFY